MNDDRHRCRRICRSPNTPDAESHALLTSAFRRNRQHGRGATLDSPDTDARTRWMVRAAVEVISRFLPPRPPEVATARGLHPTGAEVVEPGVEVKLRLLDALDWQRLRASGLCSCGGGGPKDHAFSRCLTGADGVIRFRSG